MPHPSTATAKPTVPAAAPRRRTSACAQPPLSRNWKAKVVAASPRQSAERKQSHDSALKPARRLCPWAPTRGSGLGTPFHHRLALVRQSAPLAAAAWTTQGKHQTERV